MFPRPPQPQDFNNLNVSAIPGINTAREAQYAKRIKELEEDLRLVKVENDKNVRPSTLHAVCGLMLMICVEADDCQIPRALGKVEGFCQTKEGGKGGSRDNCNRCEGQNSRGTRSGGRIG